MVKRISALFPIVIITILVILSCSTTQKNSSPLSNPNSCVEKFGKGSGFKAISKLKEISGTTLSYLATGSTYTGEFVVKVTGGMIAGFILCAPFVAIDMAASSSGIATDNCFRLYGFNPVQEVFKQKSLGEEVFYQTKSWRCPMVLPMAESMRKVAQCHADQGGRENKEKAIEQLNILLNDIDYIKCSYEDDKNKTYTLLKKIKAAPQ